MSRQFARSVNRSDKIPSLEKTHSAAPSYFSLPKAPTAFDCAT